MKYMGSKRIMLQNGLGELLAAESRHSLRIVDLFCGAASVTWFAATHLKKQVAAFDLQEYAALLAGAVVRRTDPLSVSDVAAQWIEPTKRSLARMKGWKQAVELDGSGLNTATWRKRAQELCGSGLATNRALIWSRYGGHYFSPTQSLSFDAMLRKLPDDSAMRDVCLAATVIAASQCAASPGHTAQPFKATRSAGRYLREAWLRDPFSHAQRALELLCPLHAMVEGEASVGDANEIAKSLKEGDLVFLDPPYSGVHYSRFYHVLETIARTKCGLVEGVGRYPPVNERPSSAYSQKGASRAAVEDLLTSLSSCGCHVILTFPKDECSNGLSGDLLEAIACESFDVVRKSVKSRLSTLGGNAANRGARKVSDELILVMRPR